METSVKNENGDAGALASIVTGFASGFPDTDLAIAALRAGAGLSVETGLAAQALAGAATGAAAFAAGRFTGFFPACEPAVFTGGAFTEAAGAALPASFTGAFPAETVVLDLSLTAMQSTSRIHGHDELDPGSFRHVAMHKYSFAGAKSIRLCCSAA